MHKPVLGGSDIWIDPQGHRRTLLLVVYRHKETLERRLGLTKPE